MYNTMYEISLTKDITLICGILRTKTINCPHTPPKKKYNKKPKNDRTLKDERPMCNSNMQNSPFRMNMPMAIYDIPNLILGLDPPSSKN